MLLDDALTFIDPDDRELQYLFLLYKVSLKPTDRTIKLSDDYDRYVWKKMPEIQREDLTQSTQQQLGMLELPYATGKTSDYFDKVDDNLSTSESVIIYTDGGSRGNPGPSASGFVVINKDQHVVAEGGAYLGFTTNNVAEYEAVYLALERAQEMNASHIDLRLDSQLVANQMNGVYKIRHADLLPIYNRIKEIAKTFQRVSFTHVRREHNKLADGVVNKILDAHEKS
jgi:ribonuclease HI